MNQSIAFIFGFFIFSSQLWSQHLSKDIFVALSQNGHSTWGNQCSFSEENNSEFRAVSIVIDGENISLDDFELSLTSSINTYVFNPFHEDSLRFHRYVSNMIYLTPEEDGIWEIKLNSKSDYDFSKTIIKVHVFIPSLPANNIVNYKEENSTILSCECPKPSVVPRADWGASFNLTSDIYQPPAYYTDVTHMIVHHSAGTNSSSNWKGVVASVFDLHVNVNGWQDVGYNWLIDPNGIIYDGRGGGDNVRGAHMCGYNNNTMGVCILGDFTNLDPSSAAINSLVKLLSWKSCKEDIDPAGSSAITSYTGFMAHVSGHKDGCSPNYTACPGVKLYSQLSALRTSTVSNIEDNCSSPTKTDDALRLNFKILPNPSVGRIMIELDSHLSGELQVGIYNSIGQKRHHIEYDNTQNVEWIDVSHLSPGIYILKLQMNGFVGSSKLIIL